jgi:hypothetical protein
MHPTSKKPRPNHAASTFIADAGVSGNHLYLAPAGANGLRGTVCAGAMISTVAETSATSRFRL